MTNGGAGGRPPKYETNDELQDAIDNYVKKIKDSKGKEKLTISGLCYELGFCSRQSFYDLEKDEKFSYTIKRARLFIESNYESKLTEQNATGSIFALKNFGWKDKQELEHGGVDGAPIQITLNKYLENA